jgi:hypothetical protein
MLNLDINELLKIIDLPDEIKEVLKNCKNLIIAKTIQELAVLSTKDEKNGFHEVSYDIKDKGKVIEAQVCKVKNGISVNYMDPYMRRRDPDCMLIGDELPTDKERYKDHYKSDFNKLRKETFEWLSNQNLAMFVFQAGQLDIGLYSIAIVPENAGFFALGLGLLQGIINIDDIKEKITIKCALLVAPPFRHTHFNGKQIVVHNRLENFYEIFSYNLYPGPSAKKGIYGTLLHFGEIEGWSTAHSSVVQVVTPYDNKINIMHEGASGGGKSEMNEHIHREFDGSITFGKNIITNEKLSILIPKGCNLYPVADDMAICHPSIQKNNGKLVVTDAENSWFIRVDHIKNYGTDPDIEARSIHPKTALLFFNIDAQPNSTALLWEHIEDSPGKTCPNPRFIIPREIIPDIIKKPVSVDIRSFGVRTPPCTKEKPTYGIIGIFHVLPPALAWLWRLVSPRGNDNPSIVEKGAMGFEGVGSFWPFATGKKVNHANILLKQIIANPKTHYILCPVKHIGAYEVGFMPQWIMREYLARRGGVKFTKDELSKSKCPLLGYSLNKLVIEGQHFEIGLLKVEKQVEVGEKAYEIGAKIMIDFFKKELKQYLTDELFPLGKKIINCCLSNGSIDDYNSFIDCKNIFMED